MDNSMNERGCGCSGHVDHDHHEHHHCHHHHHHEHHHCGEQCFSLGPFRAVSKVCPPRNIGSIIPFSSGIVPARLTTNAIGLVSTVSAIGFGTALTGLTISGNILNLPIANPFTEAFSVPRNGRITAISASFTVSGIAPRNAIIRAQVFRAPAGSNTFTATGAAVNLSPVVSLGTVFQGTATANVSVSAGDRLVIVFSVSGIANTALVGAASAGITIS